MGSEFWEALANLDIRTVIIGILLMMLFGSWTAVFYAIIRGKLVPRNQVEDVHHDRDLWREAHKLSETTHGTVAALLDKQSDMLDTLIVQSAITNELLNQLRGSQK